MANTLASAAEERARRALSASPIYALRELQVEEIDEALTISGRVSSFYYKQLAQELVRSVAMDTQVVNRLSVD